MITYRIQNTYGDIDYVTAASFSAAQASAEQIFPGATHHIREATSREVLALFQSHSFDGADPDDFSGE